MNVKQNTMKVKWIPCKFGEDISEGMFVDIFGGVEYEHIFDGEKYVALGFIGFSPLKLEFEDGTNVMIVKLLDGEEDLDVVELRIKLLNRDWVERNAELKINHSFDGNDLVKLRFYKCA